MAEEWETANVQFTISGRPVEMGFTVPAKPVTLRRMLPVFQMISDNFNNVGEQQLNETGKSISCKAGCGACCRQLVPVSEPEAHQLTELVDNLPEPRRNEIRKRFSEANDRLRTTGFFERLAEAARSDEAKYRATVREYFALQIACPFLEKESCSIHKDRPVACREYLVTSPAEFCTSAQGDKIENVAYLFKVKDSLITIGRSHLSPELPFIPLIRSLEWSEKVPETNEERPGRKWMEAFFEVLLNLSRQV
ncbi:MAG: YkgJ family cysteine cluster protein [Acidobacteriota bacterium]